MAPGGGLARRSPRPSPGNAIKALGLGHAGWGLVAYRKQLREVLSAGVLDSVGDGIFRKAHSDDGRAAAFWFVLAAPFMVLCGYLVEVAERARRSPGTGNERPGRVRHRRGRHGGDTKVRLPHGHAGRLLADAPGPQGVSPAAEQVEELHRRQAAMYAGGPAGPVSELLAEEVVWHIPGTSPIAGEHRGRQAVLGYFEARRRLAGNSMRLHPGELLAGEDFVIQLVDGSAEIGGEQVTWSTVGIYRFEAGRVAEAWLVPSDLAHFDRIRSRQDPGSST